MMYPHIKYLKHIRRFSMNQSHKIAVFISHIYGNFQSKLCQGIIDKASDYGYVLDFFVSNDEVVIQEYGTGEMNLFQVPDIHAYDGILISSGTYLVPNMRTALFEALADATCPILDLNNTDSPFPTVNLNNLTVIQELVKHLYLTHNLSRLCYLGSSVFPGISTRRENAFIAGMEEFNLKYAPSAICNSDFSYSSVCRALDSFFEGTTSENAPEGIVCYNDELAFLVIEELTKRGYRIPQDITVTGCDNLAYGEQISPALTTVSFPAAELGRTAFDTLLGLMDKQTFEFPIYVMAETIIKGSCGCPYNNQDFPIFLSNQLAGKVAHLESKILENIHMRGLLQSCENLDQLVEYLKLSLENYPEISDFYFFLYSDWYESDSNLSGLLPEDTAFKSKSIDLKLGKTGNQYLSGHTFANKEAITEFIDSYTGSMRLFVPLYFEEANFGFLCFSYPGTEVYYPFTFVTWLQNLNMTLKNLSDQQNMVLIKEYLQELNYRDDLTGLYNRHGFQHHALLTISQYALTQTKPVLLSLEINDFQKLNSDFGLDESNFALKTFAKALQKTLGEHAICARYRGANFQVLHSFASELDFYDLLSSMKKYLKNYQEIYNKSYLISFTYSYTPLSGYSEDALFEALLSVHTPETAV